MNRAERIAFVCPRFAEGPTVGGAETLLKALASHAANAGRRVTFLTTCARNHFSWDNELPSGSRRIGNLDVMFFPVDTDRNIPAFLEVQERISRRVAVDEADEETWLNNNVNSSALCRHLSENGSCYDKIVMGPYLFGLIYRAALIHPDRTLLVPCLHDEPFAYLRSFRRMFSSVRGFMFNTAPERDLAVRLFGIDSERASVVGFGISDFSVAPHAFAHRHGITAPYVIYSGRREPLKGTPLLVDYMSTFRERTGRDVKLVLTGSGTVDVPPAFGKHLLDMGFLSETDKYEAMAGAVAFCHPSVNESLGIVLLEAWMAGTPCLVRNDSAVLRHQCEASNGGLWFRAYPDFEEELALLIDRVDIRKTLAECGRQFVRKEYSWDATVPRMLAALDK